MPLFKVVAHDRARTLLVPATTLTAIIDETKEECIVEGETFKVSTILFVSFNLF